VLRPTMHSHANRFAGALGQQNIAGLPHGFQQAASRRLNADNRSDSRLTRADGAAAQVLAVGTGDGSSPARIKLPSTTEHWSRPVPGQNPSLLPPPKTPKNKKPKNPGGGEKGKGRKKKRDGFCPGTWPKTNVLLLMEVYPAGEESHPRCRQQALCRSIRQRGHLIRLCRAWMPT